MHPALALSLSGHGVVSPNSACNGEALHWAHKAGLPCCAPTAVRDNKLARGRPRAGCQPAGVLCEVVDAATGEMAQTPQLLAMAREERMCCVTIKDLIQHRVAREATCRVVEGRTLDAHGAAWRCVECCDGRRAAFAATGDVTSGRPRVQVIEVRTVTRRCALCLRVDFR